MRRSAATADRSPCLAAKRLHGDDTTGPVLVRDSINAARFGPMSAMTGHPAVGARGPLYATPPAIGAASIRKVTGRKSRHLLRAL